MREYLLKQIERYPQMQVEDAVKLLYQSEFGGGHMIKNSQASLKWLNEEWKQVKCRMDRQTAGECQIDSQEEEAAGQQVANEKCGQVDVQATVDKGLAADWAKLIPDCEEIGDGMCRMNLKILGQGFSPETLNQIFVQTADRKIGKRDSFERKLDMLLECVRKGEVPFSVQETENYLRAYKNQGYPPVSHSETYRRLYHPAYRVGAEYYTRYYDVFLRIDQIRAKAGDRPVVVAIDGMCGSGKSTLGRILREIYGCRLFHMDDYFLQPWQRTQRRLSQPGGNVDYERFKSEVLDHISDRDGLTYRPYDCGTQTLGEAVEVPYHSLNIVEGVYSQHPCLEEAYDLRFFCRIGEEEQVCRILKRDGQEMLDRFQSQWIPMENQYFDVFKIGEKSVEINLGL